MNRRRNARESAEESDRAATKANEDAALARREAAEYNESIAPDKISHRGQSSSRSQRRCLRGQAKVTHGRDLQTGLLGVDLVASRGGGGRGQKRGREDMVTTSSLVAKYYNIMVHDRHRSKRLGSKFLSPVGVTN